VLARRDQLDRAGDRGAIRSALKIARTPFAVRTSPVTLPTEFAMTIRPMADEAA